MSFSNRESKAAAADNSLPRVIDKYQLGATIGRGTFSRVVLVVDLDNWTRWAMKIVERRPKKVTSMSSNHSHIVGAGATAVDSSFERRLRSEMRLLQSLEHPNIVRLRETFTSDPYECLVFEWAKGGDLLDRVKSLGRLGEDEACRLFRQLVSAVRYMHEQNIVHRDLKPENLLLDEKSSLKISDFGFATRHHFNPTGEVILLRDTCGTPHYTAPEVLRGSSYDGRPADMWSCGVVLYVMLTGRFPFDGEDRIELTTRVSRGTYLAAPGVTESANDLVAKLLVTDPTRRLTAEEASQHAWCTPTALKRFDSRQSIVAGIPSGAMAKALVFTPQDYSAPLRSDSNRFSKVNLGPAPDVSGEAHRPKESPASPSSASSRPRRCSTPSAHSSKTIRAVSPVFIRTKGTPSTHTVTIKVHRVTQSPMVR